MYPSSNKDPLIRDIKNTAANIAAEGTAAAADVQDDLRKTANKTGRKVREFLDTASDEVSHLGDTVADQVRGKPIQSSLIALAAGFFLGSLFRR